MFTDALVSTPIRGASSWSGCGSIDLPLAVTSSDCCQADGAMHDVGVHRVEDAAAVARSGSQLGDLPPAVELTAPTMT